MTKRQDKKSDPRKGPTDYIQGTRIERSTWERMLFLIASGRSLRSICADEGMPDASTVTRMLRNTKEDSIRIQYTHAREDQAHALADKLLEVTETEPDPAKARIKSDNIKFYISKVLPKVYGDRLQLDAEVTTVMRPEEVAGRLAQLRAEREALERGGR